MAFWNIFKRFIISCARNSKVSNINSIKVFWFFKQVFSCVTTLFEVALSVAYSIVKSSIINHSGGKIPVKSTHACFTSTHTYTKIFDGLSVDFLSCGSIKKFTGTFFLTCISIIIISLTKSCHYLKHINFLQWVAFSPKVFHYYK